MNKGNLGQEALSQVLYYVHLDCMKYNRRHQHNQTQESKEAQRRHDEPIQEHACQLQHIKSKRIRLNRWNWKRQQQ